MKHKNDLFTLLFILTLKTLVVIGFILYGGIGLGPDEAQYWTWSQQPAWGYYSKPPGIAWQIMGGTALFGNTEFGVRFGSLVLGIISPISVFRLGRICLSPNSSAPFWAALIFALTPLGWLASFLAITDGAMIVFWTLACVSVTSALATNRTPHYLWTGLFVLCGSLFKWPIYLFWVVVFSLLPFYKNLRSTKLLLGIAVSVLGLLPTIIWNIDHDWATFRHVSATIAGGSKSVAEGNLLSFIGSQAVLLSPIFFIFLLFSLLKIGKVPNQTLFFCGYATLSILLVYCLISVFHKVQGNWCSFVYPTACVYVAWYLCEEIRSGKVWMQIGLWSSVVLSIAAFSIPLIQEHTRLEIPYKWNPFRHNVGWNKLQSALRQSGYDPEKHFLFGDKYQMSSILSFYSEGQKRAYFLNIQNARKNQFSYWPGMPEEQLGGTGYFVVAENVPQLNQNAETLVQQYLVQLKQYFQHVELLRMAPLFEASGKTVKGGYIFKCEKYNGKEPEGDLFY